MNEVLPTEEELKRVVLFVPCKDKRSLHSWIQVFLGLDMPDCIVDSSSTSSPMEMIWEAYSKMLKNDDSEFSRVLYYAARDSMKTLSAAILEVLVVLHLQRDVAHMAAIEQQARKCQGYVKDFFNKPILRDFKVGDNVREIQIVRYLDPITGINLTEKQFQELETDREKYKEIKNSIRIILATMQSSNSDHVPFFCVDGNTKLQATGRSLTARTLFRICVGQNPVSEVDDEADITVEVPIGIVCLLSRDTDSGVLSYKRVTKARQRLAQTITVVTDKEKLICTPDHPIWVLDRGFVQAGDLRPGDKVFYLQNKDDLTYLEINTLEESGERWVYDFTVADNHNFFANGILVKNCVDEVDVVQNPKAYEEAKMIPAPRDGNMPLTLLISSRKFSFGLVQKEIDEAEKTGLKIRHWNIIDVTESCPASRHRPDLPKLPIYRSDATLQAISEEEYNELPQDRQEKFVKDEGFAGCLKNCKLFASCKGYLATKQKSTSKLLRPINHTINQFRTVTVETAKAQLLCWKPSTEGLVYSRLDRDTHALTAAQIAERVTGEPQNPNMTKSELVTLLKTREVRWYGGMDFGYSHNFAVTIAAVDGNKCYFIEAIAQAELDPGQQIEVCDSRIKHYDPIIFPDTENPQMIQVFKKHGYRMRPWIKAKGSVIGGIEAFRLKLYPAVGDPELFFLKEDDGCELLLKQLMSYHWKLDAAGNPTDIPDDENDDLCDSSRYLVMNVFSTKGKIIAIKSEPPQLGVGVPQDPNANWMQNTIRDHIGKEDNEEIPVAIGRKGGLVWNID